MKITIEYIKKHYSFILTILITLIIGLIMGMSFTNIETLRVILIQFQEQ